jgi:large subunit ribosomal protein L21
LLRDGVRAENSKHKILIGRTTVWLWADKSVRPTQAILEELMYAVIRAGGKQYKVAPGDVIRVEKLTGTGGPVEFNEVLAVSSEAGSVVKPGSGASVTGEVMEQGRGAKILVFHYKKKKQYKKLRGHRQDYSAVRITEIAFDGQSFKAPDLPKKEKKVKKAPEAREEAHEGKASAKPAKKKAAKKAPAKKAAKKK